MSGPKKLITCHECGLTQTVQSWVKGYKSVCSRCAGFLDTNESGYSKQEKNSLLALSITAAILFVISNLYPIMTLKLDGQEVEVTLLSGAFTLFSQGMPLVSLLILVTGVLAPAVQLIRNFSICLLPENLDSIDLKPRSDNKINAFFWAICSWSMLEVFMLGVLISAVKLGSWAEVTPGISLWGLFGLIFIFAISNKYTKSKVHKNKKNSFARTLALSLAAALMFLPANLLPMMKVTNLGSTSADTIMSGVVHLASSGSWTLSLIIFIASILVPTVKLFILFFLLFTVHNKVSWKPKFRTQLYRFTEIIGKWSMVDIYVVTLMAALIQFQGIATIEAGSGALAFGAVVVLTIIAAEMFDPKLIWENLEVENE